MPDAPEKMTIDMVDQPSPTMAEILNTAREGEQEDIASIVAAILNMYLDAMHRLSTRKMLTHIDVQNVFRIVRIVLEGRELEQDLARLVRGKQRVG